MAQGYQYRPYNPIPPKQSAQDFSYWGMKQQPTESLPSSLAQAASQRGAEIGNTIRNEWQNYQNAPSLGEVTKSQEAYYAENPEAMPSLQDTMMGVAEKGIDWMNPVPVSGLGMIAGASSKSFDWKAVEKTRELIQSGMTKEAAAAKTGYYFDRVGNPKTQFSDVGSEVSNAEVQRVADMAFGPQSKNLLKLEEGRVRQLPTVFKHDKLYEEYPWLKTKGEVVYTDATNYAAMDAKYNKAGELLKAKILINPKGVRNYAKSMGVTYKEAMRTMILHEANHMVQAIDKLPRGSSGQWFKKMRVGIDLHEKKADQLRAVIRQMPPKAPRTNELKAELKELDDHVAFMKNTLDIDPDALYRHTTGEADSFWVQTMKDVKDPQFRVPAHERTESQRLMQEAPGRGVAPLPYVENWNSNLTPERIKALALPAEDMATLNSRWEMEQAMARGQSGLMRDLGIK